MSLRRQLQEGILTSLWRLVSTYPGIVIAVGMTLAIVSALASFFFLRLNSDQDKLVSPDLPYHERYLAHLKNFGDQEYLYVVIKANGTTEGKKKAVLFAEELNRRLLRHPEYIRTIYYRISADDLGRGALLFASPQEAETISNAIVFLAPFVDTWIRDGSLAGLLDRIGRLLEGDKTNMIDIDPSILEKALEVLGKLLKNMDQILSGKSTSGPVFDLSYAGNHYLFTSGERLLVMRVLPDKDYGTMDVVRKPLKIVRRAMQETRAKFPDVEAGLTGRPVLQADEMETTDRDMTKAAVIAVVLVGLLFVVILHGWLRPFLILISLLIAMAWSFGFATVAVGELNLLSIVFALVLVGIGVDFGVHMVMRYVEGNRSGLSVDDAVRTSMFRTGPGVILGAITSVCAFYSVVCTDFVGLAELGLIGGTGVLLCLVSMITVLPAMLLIAGRRNLFPSSVPRVTAIPFLERLSTRPGWLLLILVVITLAGLPGLFKVRFDYNLLELQAKGLESVEYERELIETSDESTWYSILTAKNLKEVKDLTETLEAMPTVAKVESILDFIPEKQALKSGVYAGAAEALGPIPNNSPTPKDPDPEQMIRALSRLSLALEALEEKLFAAGAGPELAAVDQDLRYARSGLRLLKEDKTRARLLKGLQTGLLGDIEKSIYQLKQWVTADSVTPGDLPSFFRDMYVGKDGRYQIKVIPKGNVWDFDQLEGFVSALRRVDTEVSGVPVGVLESARLMHRTFLFAAGLTIVLVSLILWLYSRSFRYVFLTILPLGVSILWLLEIMGWFDLRFNLANFFAVPILIAIGVDGGVHLLARWKELQGRPVEHRPHTSGRGLFFTSTPTAVALSFATTMIGFGGLLFAHHGGLASLGYVMVLGSLTGMLASLLVLPPALKLMGDFNKTEE